MQPLMIKNDDRERQQTLNIAESFIVQAPAGSGKTTLLIQRFLSLLMYVHSPEEVLAITFTKKAANEMRSRIVNALQEASTNNGTLTENQKLTDQLAKDVLKRDEECHWDLIHNPNRLRIQTIDSFCSFLTNQLPILSSFTAQSEISETPELLYEQTANDVLAELEGNEDWSHAIAHLLTHLDNDMDKLQRLIINLLSKRDQWLPYLHIEDDAAKSRIMLERYLKLIVTEHLQQLDALFSKELRDELIPLLHFASENCAIHEADSPIAAYHSLQAFPGISHEDYPIWLGINTLLLNQEGSWRKRIDASIGFPAKSSAKNEEDKLRYDDYKNRATQLIDTLRPDEALRMSLYQLKQLPYGGYQEAQWQVLQSLITVLKMTAAQLKLTFHRYRKIDYIENTFSALSALGEEDAPTDTALTLDYQIKHILVDEFQDTSHIQFKLIESLIRGWEVNDGRTLFLVGDPMQSIYRFRNAEVALFTRAMLHGIGHIKLVPIVLSANFRSTKSIVAWNNELFQQILPSTSNLSMGAVSHAPSLSFNEAVGTPPKIIRCEEETGILEANHIVETIKAHKEKYPDESMAILVRSRQHLQHIIPALQNANIAYQGTKLDLLHEKQAILDVITLTQALFQPSNRIAWLALLRAPWCGLTLSDLYIIANATPHGLILETLQSSEKARKLSEDGQKRLHRILPILLDKIAERERMALRVWVESTWQQLGGPACLHQDHEIDEVNAYFNLLDTFDAHHESFSFEKLFHQLERLYADTKHDDHAVQIMTIHGAKGLEFDVVLIPRLEAGTQHNTHPLLLWMEQPLHHQETALLLAPIHATHQSEDAIYRYILEQQKTKQDFELDRLLYVAATRAKKHLYLFFNLAGEIEDEYRPAHGSFLKRIYYFVASFVAKNAPQNAPRNDEATLTAPRHAEAAEQLKPSNERHQIPGLFRLSTSWQHPLPYQQKSTSTHRGQSEGFIYKSNSQKSVGTLMHRLLQMLSIHGEHWWSAQTQKNKNLFIMRELMSLGVPLNEVDFCKERIHQMMKNVMHDPKAKWILTPHHEAQSELGITALLDDQIHHLVVDRTFVDADGTRWIIDYKTASLEGDSLAKFFKEEEKQYKEKMCMYRQAFAAYDTRLIKLGLYFPAIPAFREMLIE